MSYRSLVVGALCALSLCGCPGSEASKLPSSKADAPTGPSGDGSAGAPKPEPAPAKAFDRATARTPWKYAKVGDWALYKMHGAGKELRFEVTKVDEGTVTFTVTDNASGERLNEVTVDLAEEESRYKDPMSYDSLAKDEQGQPIKPYTEAVEIKGKKIEALVIKRAKAGMGSTELWIAEKDVRPFNQCAVKSIRNGKLELELLDFGSKSGE